MATSRSTMRWCGSPRISARAIRWGTGRGSFAILAARTPPAAAELLTAALHLIDHPEAGIEELMTSPSEWAAIEAQAKTDPAALLTCKVRGPEFPTGGVLVEDWAPTAGAY